eukprot:1137844-Pelagomonas_calceolata.AAC.2
MSCHDVEHRVAYKPSRVIKVHMREMCQCEIVIAGHRLMFKMGAVVDTTGAGDAFIGSVLYGLAMGLDRPRMLQLAATVAACKCTAIGARQGLPSASQLAKSDLLGR